MHPAPIICGLGFGDEGKGRLVQDLSLLHGSSLTVRFSGGGNCGHNVFSPTGLHHGFSLHGSASFSPGARTHLSRHVLIDPYAMVVEAAVLARKGCGDMSLRLTVDPRAVIVTPWHALLNQIMEVCRGHHRHGSCGDGIGEARSMELQGVAIRPGTLLRHDALITLELIRRLAVRKAIHAAEASQLYGPEVVARACALLTRLEASESPAELLQFYRHWLSLTQITDQPRLDGRPVIFEGAQGVLLDETHGTAPYNTWTSTTFDNALELAREWDLAPVRIGVIRTFMTRHGAGPLVTEDARFRWPDHNHRDEWQGDFRQGPLDLVALRHAVRAARPDVLAVTHMDRLAHPDTGDWHYSNRYAETGDFAYDMTDGESLLDQRPVITRAAPGEALGIIQTALDLPVAYTAAGPEAGHFAQHRPLTSAARLLN